MLQCFGHNWRKSAVWVAILRLGITQKRHRLRLVVALSACSTFTILQKLYLPSILHLTLICYNSLAINALLSVRYYKFHLHATYTTYMLPHGTSTGGRYYGIGGQKSLLLRQIVLRPNGV